MKLKDAQFTVLHNEMRTLPLLPWTIVKNLLWELDEDIYEDLEQLALNNNWYFKYFIDGFSHFKGYSIIVTDSNMNICLASKNIFNMTGYTPDEMLVNSPRILQGKDTSEDAKFLIKIGVAEGIPFHSRLLNYTKSGKEYGCEIHAFPIYNGNDELSHYIGFEQEYYV